MAPNIIDDTLKFVFLFGDTILYIEKFLIKVFGIFTEN